MVVNMTAHANTKEELLEGIGKESLKYVERIGNYTQKDVKEIIKAKKEDKWSNRRIRNHFARFGMTVDLPDEHKERKRKKKDVLSGVQKTLCE